MRLLILALSLCFTLPIRAVTPEDVVRSSIKHFPQVIESIQELEQRRNEVDEARGAFDGKFKGEMDSRTTGYYNGDHYKASVEKPFPFFNSRIYGGQRQGFDSFPSYEGKYDTLSGGELFVGASVSLLRNSLIDFNRYNLRFRQQDQIQAEQRLNFMKMNVQTMALKSYWTWFVKGHELRVYKEILALALARGKQIKQRIKAGDLARIYETENNQYIRKREAQLKKSQMEFLEASYYLSLFYRNEEGKPRPILTSKDLPKPMNERLATIPDYKPVYEAALRLNPELQILSSKAEQAELDIRMGRNELLPKVDVNFEWNQDQGVGASTLQQDENRILLNVEIPFQYRKGLGKMRAGKAKLAQVKTKEQFTKEKLKTSIQALVVKLNATSEIFSLTLDQVKLAETLAKAERRKFSQGASDLILVNIREESFAEAQVKNLSTLLKYEFVNSEVLGAQMNLLFDE
jgi:outer membrane protein TolC